MAKKIMSKSTAAKNARAGKDIGKPGKGFAKIIAKTEGKYGKKVAEKIAGAKFQQMRKAGKL